jgi:hypothetical protein
MIQEKLDKLDFFNKYHQHFFILGNSALMPVAFMNEYAITLLEYYFFIWENN